MEVYDELVRECTKKLMLSRMRLLINNGFYGLLLMHLKMSLSEEFETVWSDNDERIFFNPSFLTKLTDKEVDYVLMHVLLHIVLRHLSRSNGFELKYYDQAADIVVNSNILKSADGDENQISLRGFGGVQSHNVPNGDEGWKYSVEEIYGMLLVNVTEADSENAEKSKASGSSEFAKNKGIDSDGNRLEKNESGSSVEENNSGRMNLDSGWDFHNHQDNGKGTSLNEEVWKGRIVQAIEAMHKRDLTNQHGTVPAFAERYFNELKNPQTDWRTILEEFIQEEINDYSFTPPDRRFDDSPFFLPDFNEKNEHIEKILFMIDTSGSMSDDAITTCFSEIKGAIDQFDGKLEGWLGFFDAAIIEPKAFSDEEEFLIIRPEGGGGTSFHIIFENVKKNMMDNPPVSIVILTDGYAPMPPQSISMGIPVLWIIDNEKVTPNWGKVARIDIVRQIEVSDGLHV